ncbi:DinB family protein [Bacillus sp. Marseille-Q3570]|uniref:DinB family protein n=1 Tax=Bacillus sp. Marseille-Q3570 TaxID=2963522 RepID=UPI0021B71AD0|nr:DinB family protein [Bacillus sp. Marseille-Q3570]
MLHDLKGHSNMEPVVGLLYSTVHENFQRLKRITEDMSQEELDYNGPDGDFNSTAQLLKHLAYVDLKWVYRLKGETIPDCLMEKYGPELDSNNQLPMIKGQSLNKLILDYEEVLKMLNDTCSQLKDIDLDKIVNYETGKRATIRWGIWHMSDHSRYHQAHINQLRKWYESH